VRELQTRLEPELLRAVPVTLCLSGWARHFAPPDPGMFNVDQKLYELSRPTEAYDEFFSHDWGTSRWLKLAAMLIIYNSRAAAVTACLTCALLSTLVAFEIVPPEIWVPLIVHASFWIVLAFWQRIRGLFCKPRTVFLDKLCIAQHDDELKLKGILGLAGFLDRSKQLTIFWSQRYFSRLWCTYEVATFLRGKEKPILIMPVKMAMLLFLMAISEHVIMAGFTLATTLAGTADTRSDELLFFYIPFGPVLIATVPLCFYVGLGLVAELKELEQQLSQFSIRRAQCFCCSNDHKHPQSGEDLPCDRALIFDMMKRWYGKPNDNGEEYLARFDDQVQQRLSPMVLQSVQRGWLPLSYTAYMAGSAALPGLLPVVWTLKAGPPEELTGVNQTGWALREVLDWWFGAWILVFWVRFCGQMLQWGLPWLKCFSRAGLALLLCLPTILTTTLAYLCYQLSVIHTEKDSLLPAIPVAAWMAVHVWILKFSAGKTAPVQSAKSSDPPAAFKEDVPEIDVQSNADTISLFST